MSHYLEWRKDPNTNRWHHWPTETYPSEDPPNCGSENVEIDESVFDASVTLDDCCYKCLVVLDMHHGAPHHPEHPSKT